jgi:sugar phosphate isomerase/epimerase
MTTHEPVGPKRLKQGIAAHGFGYLGGFNGAGTSRACPTPLDAFSLMDLAAANGLAGVEIPPAEYLRDRSAEGLARVRGYAEERGLYIVFDTGVVDTAELEGLIPVAKELGVRTIRVTASKILCGDRAAVRETWPHYMSEIVNRLRSVRGLAEEAGVAIAVENHQDLTSEELVGLCAAVGGKSIGVTLDAVNPLAVVEDPMAFARRVGPLIKNVHVKDYRIYTTSQGFRLVRCAIGAGVLDVAGLFTVLRELAPDATVAIELAALDARHVRFLNDEYWAGFPPRRAEEILPVLRLREASAQPQGEDWRTPWELGASHDALAAYEMGQFDQSVAYLSRF